ncbi:hypothetical protein K438DRAFT_1776990 [Mycena galopus ATCC 62051]|nr:hypothetical protein K438DRAFT_1776990 [Mycena galopus ATCC 62051]
MYRYLKGYPRYRRYSGYSRYNRDSLTQRLNEPAPGACSGNMTCPKSSDRREEESAARMRQRPRTIITAGGLTAQLTVDSKWWKERCCAKVKSPGHMTSTSLGRTRTDASDVD